MHVKVAEYMSQLLQMLTVRWPALQQQAANGHFLLTPADACSRGTPHIKHHTFLAAVEDNNLGPHAALVQLF